MNENKKIPDLYLNRKSCCGCSACFAVCPVKAISMKPDNEGFLYPAIDEKKCVGCYKCLKVCSFKEEQAKRRNNCSGGADKDISYCKVPKKHNLYAVKHKDDKIRAASRSGGIFTALSDAVLEDGGTVYGCILSENFEAVHTRASTVTERNAMRGSKYVQSSMRDVFRMVKNDLGSRKKVLFSGTPCQIAGLKKYLLCEEQTIENLYCVDVICHGVPSPEIWKAYLNWQQERNHSKVIGVDFRNKTDYGWAEHIETLWFENGKRVDSRIFVELFFGHCCTRLSCHDCPYKSMVRPSDITIGDYWGIEKAAIGFDDNKGVSFVLLNTKKGMDMFELVSEKLQYKQTRIEDSMQPSLYESFPIPDNRERFWNDFYNKPFSYMVRKYGKNKWIKRVKRKVKEMLGI